MSELDDLLDPGVTGNDSTGGFESQQPVPNANAVLVLGICSIVGCFLYGLPGLICGIIALILFKKAKAVNETNPAKYEASFKTAKAGQICAIIGTSLSAVYFVVAIFWLIFFLTAMNNFTRF